MGMFKFIHAADLHLGTPLENSSNVPRHLMDTIQNATYLAFERICHLAMNLDVDFILLAGDVFDHEARSIKAEDFFVKQMEKLEEKNIHVFMIAGNHDPRGENINDRLESIDNLHVFGSEEAEEKEFNLKDDLIIRIIGQSYRGRAESRKMINYFTPSGDDSFNIGMVHTQLDPNNRNYVPCSLQDLKNKKGIDYWALGHIHEKDILNEENPAVVYPGTPQGRHVGETGIKGCHLVTVDENKELEISFLPASPVVWLEQDLFVDDDTYDHHPENISELGNIMISEGEKVLESNKISLHEDYESKKGMEKELVKGYIIRWILKGRSAIQDRIQGQEDEARDVLYNNIEQLSNQKPFLWTESIQFRINRPIPPLDELKSQSEAFKYIDQVVTEFLNDPNMRRKMLTEFGDIWEWQEDHEDYNEKKLQLDEREYKMLVDHAKELAVEMLLERREEA